MLLICNRHGVSEHRLSGVRERWKCKKCEYIYSKRYLENLKLRCIKYGGGECQKCGYDACWRALHFHHIDLAIKEFGIFENRPGFKKVRSWDKLKLEMNKCILVCSNCHGEIHSQDEKIIHKEFDLNLSRMDIELLNKHILSGKKSVHAVFEDLNQT